MKWKWNVQEVITSDSVIAHLGLLLYGVSNRVLKGPDRKAGTTAGFDLSTEASLLMRAPIHIPNLAEGSYKTEVTLYDGPEADILVPYWVETEEEGPPWMTGKAKRMVLKYRGRQVGTLKLTWWHAGDPRPLPHNHPWRDEDGVSFRSSILSGGYTETVYRLDGSTEERVYRAGDVNIARHDEYHVVSDVLPQTVTLMACGPRVKPEEGQSPWGYLLTGDDGRMVAVGPTHPSVMDPGAGDRFKALNPHLRR
jgi:hypothetical protein